MFSFAVCPRNMFNKETKLRKNKNGGNICVPFLPAGNYLQAVKCGDGKKRENMSAQGPYIRH